MSVWPPTLAHAGHPHVFGQLREAQKNTSHPMLDQIVFLNNTMSHSTTSDGEAQLCARLASVLSRAWWPSHRIPTSDARTGAALVVEAAQRASAQEKGSILLRGAADARIKHNTRAGDDTDTTLRLRGAAMHTVVGHYEAARRALLHLLQVNDQCEVCRNCS